MADTGEDREIKQRVAAHQAETVRESNQLEERTKRGWVKKNARRNKPGRSPSTKVSSGKEADPRARSRF
jgi:DNA invertase Pin-like site-specific DNA recombinase